MDWQAFVRSRLESMPGAFAPAIVDELADHLDDLYQEARRAGRSHDKALAVAQQALDDESGRLARDLVAARHPPGELLDARWGDLATDPSSRTSRWAIMLDDFRRDVLYAVRLLLRTPTFAAVAAVTLALGIGANTAIFSLVNATLLARLPVANLDRLVYVGNGPSPLAVFSYPGYTDLRDRQEVFDDTITWGGITASLNADGQTDTVSGAIVSGNYFELLGVTAARGRLLSRDDDQMPGGHPVVVLGHGLWQGRFGGRSDIVGLQIVLNGHPFTVVGITPRDFAGVQVGVRRDVYVPMMMQAVVRPPRAGFSGEMNPDLLTVRGNQWLSVLGRLEAGVTREQAQASLSALQMALDPPERPKPENPNRRIALAAVADGPPQDRESLVSVARLLVAVVLAVLLIACANVANLLLSRAAARRREIAMRLAVGASRARLVRQLLTESVVLSLLGGLLGVLLAYGIVRAFRAWPPPPGALPLTVDFTVDGRVLLFTLVLSIVTGLVFGLVPALRASRPELAPTLKDESFVPDEHARRWNLKNALVVAQVTLSLALLVGSGLFVRSLLEAQRLESGYPVERLMTIELPVNLLRYTRAQGRDFYDRAIERAAALPGVESAAVARVAVLTGMSRVVSLHIDGRQGSDDQFTSDGRSQMPSEQDSLYANVVSTGYFATLGLAAREGRTFGAEDGEGAERVAIVNHTFVRRHFADDRWEGQRLSVNGPKGPWRTIVGVVADAKYASVSETATPIVYLPLSQNHETGMTLYVRSSLPPEAIAGTVRREIQALEPNLPLGEARAMAATVETSLYTARMGAFLISVLGALALVLASIGLYGVLSFLVSRRTREIGIRRALGADAASVFTLVVREGLVLVGIGIALGVLMARSASGLVRSFLVGVGPTDVLTYAAAATLLVAVGAVACALPAWRAAQVDPAAAIRQP